MATIYLRFPFLLVAQAVVGVVLGGGLFRAGSTDLGTAKLIMAACIVVPMLVTIAMLRWLPGSHFEASLMGDES